MLRTTLSTALAMLFSVTLFMFSSTPARAQTTGDLFGLKHRVETLEAQVALLKSLLAGVDDSATPMYLTVNCGGGQTISGALATGATTLRPLVIGIQGVCHEAVLINRDNVTLTGMSSEDGIQEPESAQFAVSIMGPNLVRLANLTITGGVTAFGGASFEADDITVQNGTAGIGGDKGFYAILRNVTVQNISGFAVSAGSGGHLTLSNSQVQGNGFGVNASNGGIVKVEGTTIKNNTIGARIADGGVLDIQNSTIQDSSMTGLLIENNGTVIASNNTVVKNNGQGGPGQGGAHLTSGAVLDLQDSRIELNSGSGVDAQDGSIVNLRNGTVQNNSGSGVFLGHTSAVTGNGQITSNSGWGVHCTGPSAWIGGFGSVQIGSNGQGTTDCQ